MSTLVIIINILLRIIQLLIFIRVIVSFFPIDDNNLFVSVPYIITEPVIMPVRSLLFLIRPLSRLPFDISPITVFLFLELLIALI